jgi:Predicted pPIWI-associating nuclease
MARNSETDIAKARRIAEAIRDIDLTETGAWGDLDVLSSRTMIDAIEVFEDEIRSDGEAFEGPINVHVTLQYPEDVTMSETFPGRFEGKWKANRPVIENVSVDTSSFYA